MRKSKMVLLAAALAVAVSAPAVSADKAGIGLNWAIGPQVMFGPFDMQFSNGFTLGWNVTDRFTVGVFRDEAMVRGEKSYTCDNTVTGHIADAEHTMVVEGTSLAQGLSFLTNLLELPLVGRLAVGLEIGTQQFDIPAAGYSFSDSDSSGSTDGADFGLPVAPVAVSITAPIMGVAAKLRVLEFETKTVTTCIDVNLAMRWIPIKDDYMLGMVEADVVAPVPPATLDKIDPVGSLNTVTLMAGVGLWF